LARLASDPQTYLGQPFQVTADLIDASTEAHRRTMDQTELLELAVDLESASTSWLRPLVSVRRRDGRYTLLAGERRFAAWVRHGQATELYVHQAVTFENVLAWFMLDEAAPGGTPMTAGEVARLEAKLSRYIAMSVRLDVPVLEDTLSQMSGVSVDDLRSGRSAYRIAGRAPEGMPRSILDRTLEPLDTGSIRPGSVAANVSLAVKSWTDTQGALPADQQGQMLANLATTLAGVTAAIEAIGPLSPNLGTSARILAAGNLRQHARRLNKMIAELDPPKPREKKA